MEALALRQCAVYRTYSKRMDLFTQRKHGSIKYSYQDLLDTNKMRLKKFEQGFAEKLADQYFEEAMKSPSNAEKSAIIYSDLAFFKDKSGNLFYSLVFLKIKALLKENLLKTANPSLEDFKKYKGLCWILVYLFKHLHYENTDVRVSHIGKTLIGILTQLLDYVERNRSGNYWLLFEKLYKKASPLLAFDLPKEYWKLENRVDSIRTQSRQDEYLVKGSQPNHVSSKLANERQKKLASSADEKTADKEEIRTQLISMMEYIDLIKKQVAIYECIMKSGTEMNEMEHYKFCKIYQTMSDLIKIIDK